MRPSDYEMWTAIGTVAAVVVALAIAVVQVTVAIGLSVRRRRLGRRKVASLVSAWISHTYTPNVEDGYYRRSVTLHLANESDEPVFEVDVVCGSSTPDGTIRLGPLAAPRTIPVLPPRREFTYDITTGVLGFGDYAHDAFHGLVASAAFRDHEGKKWERTLGGDLLRVKRPHPQPLVQAVDDVTIAQAGPVDNPHNPLAIVFAFCNLASDEEVDDVAFSQALSEQAPGWARTDADVVATVRNLLRTGNVAAHVWYPTPRIAYVRVMPDEPLGPGPFMASILTLVWRNGRGWTLFGIGPFLPWQIPFEPGELGTDPLDGRTRGS